MLILLTLIACGPTAPTDTGEPTPSDSGETGQVDTASGTSPEGCFESPSSVIVGTGEETWAYLPEGAPLTMVHGPQGGWHILGSAWVSYTEEVVDLHFVVSVVDELDEDGAEVVVGENRYTVRLLPAVDCIGYYPGMFVYLNIEALIDGELNTPPELLGGRSLRLWMAMEDSEGRQAVDERIVTAALDPQDVPEPEDTGGAGSDTGSWEDTGANGDTGLD